MLRRIIRPWIIALLLTQAALVAWRVKDTYYFTDEYRAFIEYQEMGLTWSYLTRIVYSQIVPGYRLAFAALYELAGIQYWTAAVLTVGMSVASTILFCATALRAGAQTQMVVPLGIIYIGLLQSYHVQTWWATCLHIFPGLIATLGACLALLGPDGRGPTPRGRAWAGIAFLVGLLFLSKVLFAAALLAGLLMFIYLSEGRDLGSAARRSLADMGYVLWTIPAYLGLTYVSGGFIPNPAPISPFEVLKFVGISLLDGMIAATLSLGTYSVWLDFWPGVLIAAVGFFALVIFGWHSGGRATALLWASYLAYVFASMAVVGAQRYGLFKAAPYWPRYHIEGATFLLLFTAISLRSVTVPRGVISLSLPIAYAIFVATQASTMRIPPHEDHARTRRYVENLRFSLAHLPAGCVLSAGRVPGYVVSAGSEPFNEIGRFVRLLSPNVETAVDELAPCYVTAEGTIGWTSSIPGRSSVEALAMELAGELYGGVRFEATPGWTPNGAYPDIGPMPLQGPTYGSWSGSDANTGTLRIGSISLTEATSRIAVPLVTGPEVRDLALVLADKMTGEVLVQLKPPPKVPAWRVIQIDFSERPAGTELELVATDQGAGWGQWLAVGAPRRVTSR